MQTDNTLGLTNRAFATKEEQKLRLSAKPKQEISVDAPILFNGCVATFTAAGNIILPQNEKGDKLEVVTDRDSYRKQRARRAYIATICQPEASLNLAAAAQATETTKQEVAKLE